MRTCPAPGEELVSLKPKQSVISALHLHWRCVLPEMENRHSVIKHFSVVSNIYWKEILSLLFCFKLLSFACWFVFPLGNGFKCHSRIYRYNICFLSFSFDANTTINAVIMSSCGSLPSWIPVTQHSSWIHIKINIIFIINGKGEWEKNILLFCV